MINEAIELLSDHYFDEVTKHNCETPYSRALRIAIDALDQDGELINKQSVLDILFLDPGISETQFKMIERLPTFNIYYEMQDDTKNNKIVGQKQPDTLAPYLFKNNGTYTSTALLGWQCPICGRGLSPLTSICPCQNAKGWETTC